MRTQSSNQFGLLRHSFFIPLLTFCMILCFGNLQVKAQNDIRYAPSLETSIESIIEIGIERSGQQEVVVNTMRKVTLGDQRESSNVLKDIKVNTIENSRTKATNPNKRKTRPKPSGLFGGIARAFGGDYSGLAEWGMGFADHMMEPKYNWDIKKVYYTKEHRETNVSQTLSSSWDMQEEFETTVKETYTTNINKGFMKFSVAVRNIGERSVRIKSPEFVIHFVNPDNQLVFIDQVRPEQNSEIPISIAPGQSRTFGLILKDRDFITLSRQYRSAIGVQVTMQDLFIDNNSDQLRSVAEVQEDLQDSHVRVDYFDGMNRSIRFFPISAEGKPLDELLKQVLANKSYELNQEVGPEQVIDNLILRIGSLQTDTRSFSDLSLKDQYNWRRWFITVSDNEFSYFDARRSDYIYPGYSLRIGYYSADQVLPGNQYRPIIYEKENILIRPNRPFSLPVDLREGDLIVIEDVKFRGLTTNRVRYKVKPITAQQLADVQTPNMSFFGNSYGMMSSPAQYIMKYGTPFHNSPPATHNYLIEPEEITTSSVNPGFLVKYKGQGNEDFDSETKEMIGWMSFLHLFQKTFTHVEGIPKLDFPSDLYIDGFISGINPYQLLTFLELMRRPDETTEAFINRWISEDQLLSFVVEENVRASDSRWVFPSLPRTLRPAYIRSTSSTLPSTLYGTILGNFGQYMPIVIADNQPGFTGSPAMMGMGMMTSVNPRQNPSMALYGQIALSTDSDFTNLIDTYGVSKIDYNESHRLPLQTGPQLTATVRVIRYRELDY